jgi:hypothetical protein
VGREEEMREGGREESDRYRNSYSGTCLATVATNANGNRVLAIIEGWPYLRVFWGFFPLLRL